MILRTDTKTLVMAALMDGPRHGYALAKALKNTLSERQTLANGQIYVALRGLEAEGWVLGEWNADGVERRIYCLTEAGRTEFEGRAAEWHECAEAVARLLPRRKGLTAA